MDRKQLEHVFCLSEYIFNWLGELKKAGEDIVVKQSLHFTDYLRDERWQRKTLLQAKDALTMKTTSILCFSFFYWSVQWILRYCQNSQGE